MGVYKGRRPGTWRVTVSAQGRQIERIVTGTREEAVLFEARLRNLQGKTAAAEQMFELMVANMTQRVEVNRSTYNPSTTVLPAWIGA